MITYPIATVVESLDYGGLCGPIRFLGLGWHIDIPQSIIS
jgi:hypothetical protein